MKYLSAICNNNCKITANNDKSVASKPQINNKNIESVEKYMQKVLLKHDRYIISHIILNGQTTTKKLKAYTYKIRGSRGSVKNYLQFSSTIYRLPHNKLACFIQKEGVRWPVCIAFCTCMSLQKPTKRGTFTFTFCFHCD